MAGRTFRQTRLDVDRNQAGITDLENDQAGTAATVQPADVGNVAENRINFEPESEQETSTVYADQDGYPIEPTSITDSDNQPRRKRTRSDAGQKRGPRGTNKASRVTFSSQGNLEKLLLSVHMMGAAFLKTPELRIDADESAMLAKATLDVFKAYGIPELSDKQLAMSQMLMALGTVYAPRAIIIYSRTHQKPKLVPIPFPAGAGKAVQDAQPPMQQPPAQQPQTFYGASPTPPPAQQVVQQENKVTGSDAAYVSSSVFAADFDAGLDTISAT